MSRSNGKYHLPQLTVENVQLCFGGVAAVAGVSMQVLPGELLAIVGPSGAGKTCLVDCMSGLEHPQHGRIAFEGRDITHEPPHQIARLGIGRSFQNSALFRGMTVLDNLMMLCHVHSSSRIPAMSICWGVARRGEIEHRKVVQDIIGCLEIENICHRVVRTLAPGLQKRVELGLALSVEPKVLLLDELLAGLSHEEKKDVARFVLRINRERRITTILVEHDMDVAMDIAHRVLVLDHGRLISEGCAHAVERDPWVVRAYLGEGTELTLA